ncbi:MAG: HAMP domain-containing sensor histidine kinase [Gammaproteobacteria bacterium]
MRAVEMRDVGPVHREFDLTLAQRLAIGFGALLLVIVGFSVAMFVWHSQSVEAQRDYTERVVPLTQQTQALDRALLNAAVAMRNYLLQPEPQRLANYRSYAEQARRRLVLLNAAASPATGATDVRDTSDAARAFIAQLDKVVEQRASGPVAAEDESAVVTLREKSGTSIYRLVDLQDSRAAQALDRMSTARDKVSRGLLLLAAIGVALCIGIAWFTTQSIRRPTRALVRTAAALERGDWQPALHLTPDDPRAPPPRSEMRRLSRAIGAAAGALELRERDLHAKNLKIQSQNEELQAQSEELASQNEELVQQGNELRAQSDALAESNERKNHFLGVLAHELRNPLAPISNSINILKRVPPGTEHAQRAQAVIERQTRHMIRLIDDLLDVTRISQGKIRVQSDAVDLLDAVRNCIEDQNSVLEQSGPHLAVDLPEQPLRVRGDYTRICQVFGNLLSNAIKFTNTDGTVRIRVRADAETNEAVLDVQDTGIGLDPGLIPLLFQPFSQGENAYTRTNGGLGLGLALVKALVELHGGSVTANSPGPNQGSRFTVRLPLAKV